LKILRNTNPPPVLYSHHDSLWTGSYGATDGNA
jgi:hypothetical protein